MCTYIYDLLYIHIYIYIYTRGKYIFVVNLTA